MADTFHGEDSTRQATTLDQSHDVQAGEFKEDNEQAAQIPLPPSLNSSRDSETADLGSKAGLEDSWEWMTYVDNEECFMHFQDNLAAKTSDLGSEGYTASLTNWHELLQLTAPDPFCGLIYARGEFPGTAESILARAQNRDDGGGKGTFGIQLLQDPGLDYQLGELYAHGLINYRWPHIQYTVRIKDQDDAWFEICSFVYQRAVYQIAHVQLSSESSAETQTTQAETDPRPRLKTFHFRVGGKITFGCMCTSIQETSSKFSYIIQRMEDGKSVSCQATSNACRAQNPCRCQLGMQVYVNGEQKQTTVLPTERLFTSADSQNKPADTNPPETKPNNRPPLDTYVNISELIDVEVEVGKNCLLMVVFAFTNGALPELPQKALSSDFVRDILGVTDGLNNCVSRIWKDDRIKDHDQIDANSINSIARCVEYICSVKAIPVPGTQNVPVTHSATASVTAEKLSPEGIIITSNSPTPSNRTSIEHEVEQPINAPSVNPESELPKKPEFLHVLVNGTSQQSNGGGRIASPSPSTLCQPEDGESSPSPVPLPVSGKSFSSVEDLKTRAAENQRNSKEVEDKDDTHEVLAVTLIRNIMNAQYVNLEDTFWHLRFLVKADQFLLQHFGDFDSPAKIQEIQSHDSEFSEASVAAYKEYKTRLRGVIEGVLLWIINLSWGTEPESKWQSSEYMDPSRHIRAIHHHQDQRFWLFDREIETEATSPFYLFSWSSRWQTSCFASITINYVLTRCAWIAEALLPKNELWSNLPRLSTDRVSRDLELNAALLQWLHSVCLMNILEMANKIPSEDVKATYSSHIKNLERLCLKLRKPSQKADFDLYTEEEEKTDHLTFACKELSSNIASNDNALNYVLEKIQQRIPTRIINAGISISKRAPLQAPWELSCLNHHISLKVAVDQADNENFKAAKEACFEFQSSDLMFLPTWDRSRPSMLKRWWNTDVSSIVCATLLDFYSRPADKEDSPLVQRQNKVVHGSSISKTDSLQVDWNWTPTTSVFEDEWVQSLEDTPDRFRSSQTKTISLRHSLDLYLRSFRDFKGENPPSYSRDNIYELIPAEDLLYLSVFDFEMDWPCTSHYCGRDDLDLLRYRDRFSEAVSAPQNLESLLWAWVIDGHPWECLANTERFSDELRAKLQEPDLRQNVLKDHQSELLRRLSDSLVDQNIKYRIMLVQRCSPSVVQAFVYMWHPRAIDTFDNYFTSFSNYADSRETQSWSTSIALVHWAFDPPTYNLDIKSTSFRSRYSEDRLQGEYPPRNVRMSSKNDRNNRSISGYIEERSSIIVITGDAKGYMWTCSIWSSLIETKHLPVASIKMISELFAHQQSTGRDLIFLALLGCLCERLAAVLEEGLEKLKSYVELGQNVFLEGYDWEADDAVDKLRSMLWGLEALKMFDARLAPSLDKIEAARRDIVLRMENEPGKRHNELDRAYRLEVENFEKRRGLLLGVQQKISLKIAQVTSLRDGLSAVTNVQDSHIAIKQGNNIRMLTYITIAYLPLGFITALFSMGHGIVPDDAGSVLFVVLVVVFVLATYCLAISLDSIFKLNSNLMKNWRSKHPNKFHNRLKLTSWNRQTQPIIAEATVEGKETDIASQPSRTKATADHRFGIFQRRRRVAESDPGSVEKGMLVESTEHS
ncbi:hypothetical protein MMC17_009762 [Xylographa soralifera]|nr:hypothetical protein [Xylographa soralifera]